MIEMPIEEYLADPNPEPSFDSSTAWTLITRSPRHAQYEHPKLNPSRESDRSNAMDMGCACHALFLEQDESRFVVIEADDWRTKAAKEARDQAYADGMIPLLAKQHEEACKIVEQSLLAIKRCTELADLAPIQEHPLAEQVCLWQEQGTWCKARPDLVSADRKVVLNYKTTKANADPESFGTGMLIRSGYHVQAYHHARGVQAEAGESIDCVWLIQEVEPPYAASILGMSPALHQLAESQWLHALGLWRECLRTNQWPAYPSRVCWIEPPPWMLDRWGGRTPSPNSETVGANVDCTEFDECVAAAMESQRPL